MASWPCSLLLLSLAAGAPERPPPRVGVVVQTAVNLTPDKQIELGERVKAALTAELLVDVTAGREVARRLDASSLPADCFDRPPCRERVAKLLEVQELLLLAAVRLGTRLQIEPTWVDVAACLVVGRDALVADSVQDDLSQVLRRAAPGLLPHVAPRPPPVVSAPPPSTATATATATAPVAIAPPPPRAGPPVATWVAGGVAVAALAVGIGLGVSAQADYDALEADGCATRPCDPGRVDGVDDKALAADLLYATAAAAAVTGLVWWWLDDGAAPAAVGGPVVGPDRVGWAVGGRF